MKSTIVVGVSGAAVSERVVDWAIARAARTGQRIEVVAVVGGAVGAVGEDDVLQGSIAAARALADGYAAKAAADGVEAGVRVEAGSPVDRLVVASEGAALLVIGSDDQPSERSRRGLHGLRIAAAATCPVVVVPDVDPAGRTGVVVGVDGSEISENALRFAAAEADRLGEPLVAVAVWSPLAAPGNGLVSYPDLYLEHMQAGTEEILAIALAGLAADYPDLVVERVVACGYPSQILEERAAGARLLVVGSHGRGALRRLLLGSISHEVLAHPVTATAVVR